MNNQNITCPICKSKNSQFVLLRDEISKKLLKNYFVRLNISYEYGIKLFNRSIFVCNDCKLHFIYPMYDDVILNILYSNYSLPVENPEFNETRDVFISRNRNAIVAREDMIINFGLEQKAGMKVLDVGSYKGLNHIAFSRFGFDTYGIELSESAAKFCAEKISSSDKVFVGEFTSFNFDTKFDLITMHHVIEHVIDIDGLMDKVNEVLVDDGYIIIETPLYEYVSTLNRNGRFVDIYHTMYLSSNNIMELFNRYNYTFINFYPIYFTITEVDSHVYGCYLFKKTGMANIVDNYKKLSMLLEDELIDKLNKLIDTQNIQKFNLWELLSRKFNAVVQQILNKRLG